MTQTGFSSPSIDPASLGDLSGTIRFILTKFLQGVDDMLPAKVISYDRATNRASVQPMIAIVDTSGRQVSRGSFASIPVLQLGGGGFVISAPLQPGDLGWIKANDRDISLFLQNQVNSPPNTQRKHSFEDAVFIPDVMMRQVVISGGDPDALVIQNLSGTVKIALHDDHIDIVAPNVNLSGNLTATGDIIASGISLTTHLHGGVTTGAGQTGVPV